LAREYLWATHESARDLRCGGMAPVTSPNRTARPREQGEGGGVDETNGCARREEVSVAEMQTKEPREEFTAENTKRPSRNQKIERSPSYISPVAGERRAGAWRVRYPGAR